MFREVLSFCVLLSFCNAANILYLITYIGKSQYIMLKPIGLELARRGHNVTVITVFKEDDPPPNYHQVLIDEKIFDAMEKVLCLWPQELLISPCEKTAADRRVDSPSTNAIEGQLLKYIGGKRPSHFTSVDLSAEERHNRFLWNGGLTLTEIVLNSTRVKQFLDADHNFDVVISEQFFQEATYILAHKYKAPLVLITSYGNCMRHNIATRNPLQLATVMSEFLVVEQPKSFFGRLRNLYFTVYEYVWWRFWYLEKMDKLAREYVPNLKEPVPSLYQLQQNVSMFLINSHFSVDPPTAYLPNIVEIGGVHLSPNISTLPKDLQKVLDDSKDGVIYMTFGSNIQSSKLPMEKRNAFLNVFKKLSLTVVWKWEDDHLENKPENVVLRKWLPQNQVLAHPNIRVFISHGGLIGVQEAIYHGVPIIGIPIYGDQYNNLLQMQQAGMAKILQFHDINEKSLETSLNEILKDVSYMNRAKEISRRFKDRPMSPLDTAVYWIEYIIRNKGATYMKNPGLELSWIEYNMLDVYAFLVMLLLILIYLVMKIMSAAGSLIFDRYVVDIKNGKVKEK